MSPPRWSSTRRLWRASLKLQNTLPGPCMTCIFEPKYEEFKPRTIWSLSNAFTSAFKELDPIPQFKATAKLGELLEPPLSPPSYLFARVAPPPTPPPPSPH